MVKKIWARNSHINCEVGLLRLFGAFICLCNHLRFKQQALKVYILLYTMHQKPGVNQTDVGSALE